MGNKWDNIVTMRSVNSSDARAQDREGALKCIDSDTDTGMTLQARVKVYTMQRQQNVSERFFKEGG